jgi:hypothetical protein
MLVPAHGGRMGRVWSCHLGAAQRARQHPLQHFVAADEVVIERRADVHQNQDDQDPAHPAVNGEQWGILRVFPIDGLDRFASTSSSPTAQQNLAFFAPRTPTDKT